MTNPPRVLDLQYGSFACRLEGFDDPVTVLQQVVRYLHDLDGLARGGAPADLDDLARLAAQGGARSVQAHLAAGKLTLRSDPVPPEAAAVAWRDTDDDFGRILSQADAQLNAPQMRRQRDSLAQLRAAVAATEAARKLGEPEDQAALSHARFRDDLGAIPPVSAAPNPMAQRLQQIAAHRVPDRAAGGDFATYLAQAGAISLDDAIAAAAAYLTQQQGLQDFSRPQAMMLVQGAAPGPIPRDDSLRAFGRLLRQNRIIKLDNGRFTLGSAAQGAD